MMHRQRWNRRRDHRSEIPRRFRPFHHPEDYLADYEREHAVHRHSISLTIHLPYLDNAEYTERVGQRVVAHQNERVALSALALREDRVLYSDSISWFLHGAVYPPQKRSYLKYQPRDPHRLWIPHVSSPRMRIVVSVDKSDRIQRLCVGGSSLFETRCLVHLPAALGTLERLESIDISSCVLGYIPHEALAKLPRLKSLELHSVEMQTPWEKFPFEKFKLPTLERLLLNGIKGLPATPRFFAWIRDNMPRVHTLKISQYSNPDNLPLLNNHMHFSGHLRKLTLGACNIDEAQLETLLFEVLPGCPGIEVVDLDRNNIRSLRSVHQRVGSLDKNWDGFRSRLQTLSLLGNPIEVTLANPESPNYTAETEAATGILRAFSTIRRGFLGSTTTNNTPCNGLGFEMLLNAGGRCLLQNKYAAAASGRLPPLSVWPLLLAELDHKAKKRYVDQTRAAAAAAAARFYFLRHGPVFSGGGILPREGNEEEDIFYDCRMVEM